jgi:hypothetical protein
MVKRFIDLTPGLYYWSVSCRRIPDLAFFTALGDMACWMMALEEWQSY